MLIVDGSVTIAKLFAETFERRGWIIATCSDRDCAMSRLAGSDQYDVVLLSYHVPGTDGVTLVRFIRAIEHRMRTAVLMVTGNGEVTDQARAAGADEVLLKPINPNSLVCAVDKQVS